MFLPRAWSLSCSPQPGWAPGYFHGGLVDAGPLHGAALPPCPFSVVFLGLGGRRSCGGGDILRGHRGLALHSP